MLRARPNFGDGRIKQDHEQLYVGCKYASMSNEIVISRFPRFISNLGYPALYASLFGVALMASLFFNGVNIEYFAIVFILLCLLFAVPLWQDHDRKFAIPIRSPLVISALLFLVWLGITLLWSPVGYISAANFWWVGSGCLVFLLTTLIFDHDKAWRSAFMGVLLLVFVLALMSLYQKFVLGLDPRSTFLTRNSHAAFLMLVVLSASGYYLHAPASQKYGRLLAWALGIFHFAAFFAIAITGSRGAALGLLLGAAVMTAIVYRAVPIRRLLTYWSLLIGAYLVADVALNGFVVGRLGSLSDIEAAGFDRYLIWRQAWRMLMESPWLGIGLGIYWLYWPPYRDPADASGGYYVHNDYLQIWIEAGLPGLLLLLAVYVSLAFLCVRALRFAPTDRPVRIEIAALFGALLAIAAHTFVDFNLYILPIQLVLGLVLVRLHALCLRHTGPGALMLRPSEWVSLGGYRLAIVLVTIIPLLYFSALGASAYLTSQARDIATRGDWAGASRQLTLASRLTPSWELVYVKHADLLRSAITFLPADSGRERGVLFQDALALLDSAERKNPVRPHIFFIRAALYQQNPDLAGEDWSARAQQAYATALRHDPLAYWAREAYGLLLVREHDLVRAREVLDVGAEYFYSGTATRGYFSLLASVRRLSGDEHGALAAEERFRQLTGQPLYSAADRWREPRS